MENNIIEILNHDISYYYEKDQIMPEHEQEHIQQMINEGYSSGELNDNENSGWWSIEKKILYSDHLTLMKIQDTVYKKQIATLKDKLSRRNTLVTDLRGRINKAKMLLSKARDLYAELHYDNIEKCYDEEIEAIDTLLDK